MITLTLREKKGKKIETRNIEIPVLWEELPFSVMMKILNEPKMTDIKLLSMLSDLSEDYILNIPSKDLTVATDYLFFLRETPRFGSWKKPEFITIDGVKCAVPKMREESWGQKTYLQNTVNALIAEEKSPHLAMPYALSLYFYPKVTGDLKYDELKIQGFIPKVMKLATTEAAPIANFFLTNYVRSWMPKQKRFLLSLLRRNLQPERVSLRSLV